MKKFKVFAALGILGLAIGLAVHIQAAQRVYRTPSTRLAPKLVPVAETRLLMEGLAHANFKGLENMLKAKPADSESWVFARGQALLVAETGNLLMLRPPRNAGERPWMERAMDLRASATRLARTLASKDFDKSRNHLSALAGSCNACHQSFKIKVRIRPFAQEEKGDGGL